MIMCCISDSRIQKAEQNRKTVVQSSFQCNRRAIKVPKVIKNLKYNIYIYYISVFTLPSANITNFMF
jgi:hypothetical protein